MNDCHGEYNINKITVSNSFIMYSVNLCITMNDCHGEYNIKKYNIIK